jgi:hypothetical protein
MSRWSATVTAKILEVFALNYKVLIEAFIHVRVVTPLLLNFNAVALHLLVILAIAWDLKIPELRAE